jgi:hypothetical protein
MFPRIVIEGVVRFAKGNAMVFYARFVPHSLTLYQGSPALTIVDQPRIVIYFAPVLGEGPSPIKTQAQQPDRLAQMHVVSSVKQGGHARTGPT